MENVKNVKNFFRQNEILFYAEIQQKFTYLPIQIQ